MTTRTFVVAYNAEYPPIFFPHFSAEQVRDYMTQVGFDKRPSSSVLMITTTLEIQQHP